VPRFLQGEYGAETLDENRDLQEIIAARFDRETHRLERAARIIKRRRSPRSPEQIAADKEARRQRRERREQERERREVSLTGNCWRRRHMRKAWAMVPEQMRGAFTTTVLEIVKRGQQPTWDRRANDRIVIDAIYATLVGFNIPLGSPTLPIRHGGARRGAGRPPLFGVAMTREQYRQRWKERHGQEAAPK
jgi:hypothetical protein